MVAVDKQGKMSGGNPPTAVGDLYVSSGRCRFIWVIDSIIDVPRRGTLVQLAQVDGAAKFVIPAQDLVYGGFKPVREARLARWGD
jgi:hypothetical protein